jgi:hypothetical protein
MNRRLIILILAPALLAVWGCDRSGRRPAMPQPGEHEPAPPPSNRIDLPPMVRQNLGITFAKVERRRVASTIRVPGRFELLPGGRREYRTSLPGWVHLLVGEYEQVQKGTPLFQQTSPEWHRLRKRLHESQAAIEKAAAELAVARHTLAEAQAALGALEERVAALAGAEVRRAELEAELGARRASIPRLDAGIRLRQSALDEARHDFVLEIDAAAALLGMAAGALTETIPDAAGEHGGGRLDGRPTQRWYAISRVGREAGGAGIVESLGATDGSWVDASTLVAVVLDPAAIRFRAIGLQSDLGRLRDGLGILVVPPQGSGIDPADVLPGKLRVGLVGDPDQRTIELMAMIQKPASWARPGVSALMEITVEDSGPEDLAIPLSAVVRDELRHIFYRRDPNNPDRVMRVEADLGVSDGRWIVVRSGVKAGDEVVLEGAYELKLAGGGRAPGGGHFHADGTWHADPAR